jgi:site-specific recombinase XerD
LVEWWHESLGSSASPRTRRLYRDAADALVVWLRETGRSLDAPPTRPVLDAYFAAFRARPNRRTGRPLSPSYVQQHWRSLQQFFKWLHEEELIDRDPYASMHRLPLPESPVPIFTDDELRALLRATEGKDTRERRDRAIIRVLLDTGVRVAELVGVQLDDVDFSHKTIFVTGKASHPLGKLALVWLANFANNMIPNSATAAA